ncbi:MAG: TrpR YerC/YecD [Clostridia bacterium]|nr:TrpR YerC/YecD [Clostridia bacterium]
MKLTEEIKILSRAILSLETEEECEKFLTDLCTVREISSMAQRITVARLLQDKKTFTEIEEATGMSSATIARINKCLQYGADGYNLVLDKLDK